MKKFLGILVLSLAMLVFPTMAQAKAELVIEEQGDCIADTNETCKKKFNISVVSDTEEEFQQLQSVVISYVPKDGKLPGIKDMEFTASSGWEVNAPSTGNGYIVNYTSKTGPVKAKTIDLGTITANIYTDSSKYDYTTKFLLGDCEVTVEIEVESNPHTGANLPLIILGVGLVIAVGACVIAKKNTKLYKI